MAEQWPEQWPEQWSEQRPTTTQTLYLRTKRNNSYCVKQKVFIRRIKTSCETILHRIKFIHIRAKRMTEGHVSETNARSA